MKAVLATTNPGKVREVAAILASSALEVVTVPMWIGSVEVGRTHLDNAMLKAQNAARLTDLAVLAEDSGLEVDALAGLPGVRSARFAGPMATDTDNTTKLLHLLDGVADRSARYRATAVLLLPSGREVVAEGVFEGSIADTPRGEGGFGYDPVFIPAGEERTAAELTPAEKDAISHRAAALQDLLKRL